MLEFLVCYNTGFGYYFEIYCSPFEMCCSMDYNSKKDCIRGIHRFCKRVGIKRYTIKEG